MRNIYLIDFENVGSDGLNGVSGLTEEDMVVLFYSIKSDKIAIRTHIQIGKSSAAFEYAEVSVGGKNALDHQLSTYLGFLVAKHEAQKYYIVSRDNGYQYISKFWAKKGEGACVECIPTIRASLAGSESQNKERGVQQQVSHPQIHPQVPRLPDIVQEPVREEIHSVLVLEQAGAEQSVQSVQETPAAHSEQPKNQDHLRYLSQLESLPMYAVISPAKSLEVSQPVSPKEEPAQISSEVVGESKAVESAVAQEEKTEEPAVMEVHKEQPVKAQENRGRSRRANGKQENGSGRRNGHRKPQENAAKQETHKEQPVQTQEAQQPSEKDEHALMVSPQNQQAGQEQMQETRPARQSSKNGKGQKQKRASQDGKTVPSQEELQKVDRLLSENSQVSVEQVHSLILSGSKQKLCNSLRKNLGQEKGLELYNQIKSIIWK